MNWACDDVWMRPSGSKQLLESFVDDDGDHGDANAVTEVNIWLPAMPLPEESRKSKYDIDI